MKTNENECYNEWQRVLERMTTSYSEWQWVAQRVITSVKTSYNKWQRMIASDMEWQWVVISTNFLFFGEEPSNRHPKENPLNLDEDLEEEPFN